MTRSCFAILNEMFAMFLKQTKLMRMYLQLCFMFRCVCEFLFCCCKYALAKIRVFARGILSSNVTQP